MSADLVRITSPDHKERLNGQNFRGLVVPLLTPYVDESPKPQVATNDLELLVRNLLPHADGLFPAGNAGEGPSLDLQNYAVLLKTVVKTRNKHDTKFTPVLAGVLKKEPEEIIQFCHTAEEAGVDGIIIAPMYGGHNPEKVIDTVLNITNISICLYNNPDMHGGKELPLEVIKSARDNYPGRIIGIKSSSKRFEVFEQILKLKTNTFKVFQGNTNDAADSLQIKADGIVPVQANMKPRLFKSLESSSKNKGDVFEMKAQEIEILLSLLKKDRAKLGMNSAQIVKHYLVKQGTFKSSKMYSG